MNKQLTPLEAFNMITSGGCKGKYHEYCEIVETALKENEYLKTELLGQSQELNAKNKALDIIKEKVILSKLITNKEIKYYLNVSEELTQEEFDLLKEWLE